jgi:hypothetical protein
MIAPDFIISTGAFPGANLSKPGHWGNRPFANIEDAEKEALRQNPGARIAREHIRVRTRMFR